MKNTLKPGWLIYIPWHPKHKGGVNSVVKNLITEIPRHSEWETFLAYQSWSNEGITNEKKELPLKIRRLYSIGTAATHLFTRLESGPILEPLANKNYGHQHTRRYGKK